MPTTKLNTVSLYDLTVLLKGILVDIQDEHAVFTQLKINNQAVNLADPLCRAMHNAVCACSMAALLMAHLNQEIQKGG